MLDTIVESRNRTVRGNRTLILLRLLLATVSLAILLLQESIHTPAATGLPHLSTSGQVTALTFSPDGQLLYSGGSDAAVRIWAK